PGAKKREPNKKTNILSREFFSNVAIIIIVSGQKLIFQSALNSSSFKILFVTFVAFVSFRSKMNFFKAPFFKAPLNKIIISASSLG
ncbi:MAG: hypothetical protein LBC18_11945, partial [Opitutaceae bacterium]|nr:hypothetical protein [Opitutaceae bacterium]